MRMDRLFTVLAAVAMAISMMGPTPLCAQGVDVASPDDRANRHDDSTLRDSLKSFELQLDDIRAELRASAHNDSSSLTRPKKRRGIKRHQRGRRKRATSIRKLEDLVDQQSKRLREAEQKIRELEQNLAIANARLLALGQRGGNAIKARPSTASVAELLQAHSIKLDLAIMRLEALQTQIEASSPSVADLPVKPMIRRGSVAPEQLFEEITKHRHDLDVASKRDFDEAINRLKTMEERFANTSEDPELVVEPAENDVSEGDQRRPSDAIDQNEVLRQLIQQVEEPQERGEDTER